MQRLHKITERFVWTEYERGIIERWRQWLEMLENYFVAVEIHDNERKLALLRYTGGLQLRQLYNSLIDPVWDGQHADGQAKGNVYDRAVNKLSNYFMTPFYTDYSSELAKRFENHVSFHKN